MQISKDGIGLIIRFKGCRLDAYRDQNNNWAIGYGHTANVYEDMRTTMEDARALLVDDLRPIEEAIDGLVTVPLNQHMFDALVALTYDLGIDTLRHSDLLAFLNAHQYDRAADAFLEFGDGMRDFRRQAERALFQAPPPEGLIEKFIAWLRK